LSNSQQVYEQYEEARHKAEVNHVLSHDAQWIKKFLEGVLEKRGFDAYKKLRDDVFNVWVNK
jgi:DNA-binding transcriptional regulator YbjK